MRSLFLWLLALPAALAQPVISCNGGNPVKQGASVTCTSSAAIATWSVVGLGTITPINSTSATYTAPLHVTPNQQWGGCQVLPNDHIINRRVDFATTGLPADPNSDAMIAQGANSVFHSIDFGINSVGPGTPTQSMVFNYSPASNGAFYFPVRPWLKEEAGIDSMQIVGQDHHFLTVARDTCKGQEIYSPYPIGFNALECLTCNAQSGMTFDMSVYALPPFATDAAGMPIGPLTYKKAELAARSIKHAGRFTMSRAAVQAGGVRWPATSTAGGDSSGLWPMGARVRLKASFDISSIPSDIGKALATSWRDYGIFMTDTGTSWLYSLEQEAYTQEYVDAFNQIHALIDNTKFEVVNESSLKVSDTSGVTATPDALVKGHPASGPDGTTAVALIGVTIGTDYPTLTVQAGAAAFQVNAWVNGSTNTGLTWTLAGDGALSVSGVYTPPSTEAAITTATITATSAADGAVALAIPVTLLPGGTIRINEGDPAPYTDPSSHIWYGDINTSAPVLPLAGGGFFSGGYIPAWDTEHNRRLLDYTGSGLDNVHVLRVPNGNYQVQFTTGASEGEDHADTPEWDATTTYAQFDYVLYNGMSYYSSIGGNVGIVPTSNQAAGGAWTLNERCANYEAQGQVGLHSFDTVARGNPVLTGVTVTVPAKVTDGVLSIAHRWAPCLPSGVPIANWGPQYLGYGYSYGPIVGSFSVTADAAAPHIAIDTTLNTGQTLHHNQTLQLYAVGWYMANTVTWGVSGGGSINAAGLYTAPSTPKDATITVTATSTTDGSKTATATFNLAFGVFGVTPANQTISISGTQQFSANLSRIPYSNVTWSVVTGHGTIDAAGLYTAPNSLATDETVTVRATSIDDPTKSGDQTLTVTKTLTPVRFSCSSFTVTDSSGHIWGVFPGMTGTTPSTNNSPDFQVSNLAPDDPIQGVYQSVCYQNSGTSSFVIPAPAGHQYQITLKFNNTNAADPHIVDGMNWTVNGTPALTNYNLFAEAGGYFKAHDEVLTFTPSVPSLTITATPAASHYWEISGVEVLDMGVSSAPAMPASVTISGGATISGRVSASGRQ